MKLPNIPLDKQAHMFSGMALALTIGIFFSPFWGFFAAIVAGIAKEAWDKAGHGTPDAMDMIATMVGGVAAFVVFMIKDML